MQRRPVDVVGKRVGAFLIDVVLLTVVNFIVFFAFADTDDEIARRLQSGDVEPSDTTYGNFTFGDTQYSIVGGKFLLYLLIIFAIGFLYYGVLQGIKGYTLGKLATGVRVVDDSGQFPGVGKATIRWLGLIIDSAPWLIPYILGFVLIVATEKRRRVGDMLAKTTVVGQEFVGQPPYGPQPAYGAPGGGYGQPPVPGYGQPPAGVAPPQGGQPADWYPDPHGQARLRYWDGSRWTDHTSP